MIREGGYGTWAEPVTQSTTFRFLYRLKILDVYVCNVHIRAVGRYDEREREGPGGLNQFHKVQTFGFLYSQNVHFVQFETPTV